ncbi:hypothetical protein [Bacillus sp. KH172YL63]|uniref:hypothetical protein n=1 Tax=Bacillus sp. KH172YL63 TaxID=2709784 RepID=UPI0013E466CD|nr:hypothetical protein [Bacillus sp. KH172YL63]BCB02124.1 hypothetical protein KH172YL63_02570 [Bacillus sp. KH172YL63]
MFSKRRSIIRPAGLSISFSNANIIAMPIHSTNTFGTINTTNAYNEQFDQIFTNLNERRQELHAKVSSLSHGDTSLRNEGVSIAWKYEQAEIKMGGQGTAGWSKGQRQEILDTGKVRGAEGHHINSVKDHPGEQANPDNIKIVKSKQEHLAEHGGDFRNPTEGELVDRNARLEDVNNQRVFKNELTGIGLAAAIGLGVGFTIGAIATLAKHGVSSKSLMEAGVVGLKTGTESSALAVVNHGIVRGIGEAATTALAQTASERLGFALTENLLKMCNMAVVGAVSSIVFSAYVFIKLKWKGNTTSFALKQAGKTLGYSLGVLFISIVAQGIWGGYAGLIASLSIGILMTFYHFIKNKLFEKLLEEIRHFTINKVRPIY